MKIAICLGNVPDTTTKVRFTGNNTRFDPSGVQWIINPWDELALTRALELKEDTSTGINEVAVINVGRTMAEATLRKAMAIGADNATRIDADADDAYTVAARLAAVLKEQSFDLVLCGIESSDYNNSSVGGMLAEFLGLPSLSAVSGVFFENGQLTVHRDIDGGKEKIAVPLPVLLIVQKGIAREPRIPSMRGIMMARQKPLSVVPGIDVTPMTEYLGYELPPPKPPCKKMKPEEVKELVNLLHNEAKVI